MEQTSEFRRRAFGAAGPVFLVVLGVLLFGVMAVAALVAGIPANVSLALLGVAAVSIISGLAWGASQGRHRRVDRNG